MKQLTKLRNLIKDNPDAVKCLNEFEEKITNKMELFSDSDEEYANVYHMGIWVGLYAALNMKVNDDN